MVTENLWLRQGITPAHAGKSPRPGVRALPRWDHPRTRGEKVISGWPVTDRQGSPPHTRGKVHCMAQPTGGDGITPAHAGKGALPVLRSVTRRITPAHAGKSTSLSSPIRSCRDHPRTRGEKAACQHAQHTQIGSPPHTRGKEHRFRQASSGRRITPAHAGKRSPPVQGYARSGDHPRACGEKNHCHRVNCSLNRSPPRMRGKEGVQIEHLAKGGAPPHARGKGVQSAYKTAQYRITPARAGKRDRVPCCAG